MDEDYSIYLNKPKVVWDTVRLYEVCQTLIGKRVDVVDGDLVQNDDGVLIVSQTIQPNCILVNLSQKTAFALSPMEIAIPYKMMVTDCAALTARWQDKIHGTDMYNKYRQLRLREFLSSLDGGVVNYMKKWGMVEVPIEGMRENDVLLYKIKEDDTIQSHTATFLGNGKILHQKPNKLSSIDDIDMSCVQGVYRYGN